MSSFCLLHTSSRFRNLKKYRLIIIPSFCQIITIFSCFLSHLLIRSIRQILWEPIPLNEANSNPRIFALMSIPGKTVMKAIGSMSNSYLFFTITQYFSSWLLLLMTHFAIGQPSLVTPSRPVKRTFSIRRALLPVTPSLLSNKLLKTSIFL